MRTILFIHDYPLREGGGIEVQTYEDARELALRGFDVSIVSSRAASETYTPAETYPCRTEEGILLDIARTDGALEGHIERNDIVHIQATFSLRPATLAAMERCIALRKPFALTLHTNASHIPFSALAMLSDAERRARLSAFRRLLSNPLCSIVGVSGSVRDTLAYLGLLKRADIIHNAKRWERFDAGSDSDASIRIADLTYIGEVSWMKGMHLLLAAMTLLIRARPSTLLRIVGDGQDKAAVRALVEALGLARNIEFLPYTPNAGIPRLLRRTRALVHPSLSETWGNVVMEAAGLGVPVVASATEGLIELLEEGRLGTLFARGNARSCASALLRVLRALDEGGDGSEVAKRAQLARERVRARYTMERRMERLCALYRRMERTKGAESGQNAVVYSRV